MMRIFLPALMLLIISQNATCNTVARFGGLFPVTEMDIREVIMKRLESMEQSGEIEMRKEEMIAEVKKQVERPAPSSLTVTAKPVTFYVDPSITVNENIYGADGVLLAEKGQHINPFERIQFTKTLIFFDADDARQVAFVKSEYRKHHYVKFILTGGSVIDAGKLFGRVYFDINQTLSQKLHLAHVPSVVVQDGMQWKITEGKIV